MLKRINDFQKEIALCFISIFMIAGLNDLKASIINSSRNRFDNLHIPFYTGTSSKPNICERSLAAFDNKSVCLYKIDNPDGGPGQPEMSTFKSVGVEDLVTPFSGDFSYNIPLMDVGGYPINLFYNSGITMDQEASWVGLGWNINPGTINRNMRGIPDDFDGSDEVVKVQSMRPDITWGLNTGADVKLFGLPSIGYTGVGLSTGISFNNRAGIALEAGVHPSVNLSFKAQGDKTVGISAGANFTLNSRSGAFVTPSVNFTMGTNNATIGETNVSGSIGTGFTYSSRAGITGMHLNAGVTKSKNLAKSDSEKKYLLTGTSSTSNVHSSSVSFMYPTVVPSTSALFTRTSWSISLSIGGEFYGANVHPRIGGYFTKTWIAEEDVTIKHPAYGMLYAQDANNNPYALLDFNRINDGVYTPNSPAIALPNYTYDIFSISGEGTGGTFKATRADLGFIRDVYVQTKEKSGSLGFDLGFGNVLHGGFEATYTNTPTTAGDWKVGNMARDELKFKTNEEKFQAVYFKNPGEKTVPDMNFQESVGGENLIRLKFMTTPFINNQLITSSTLLPKIIEYDQLKNVVGEKLLSTPGVQNSVRDKRTQVISFLTADEASVVGFDKQIKSYHYDHSKVLFGNCEGEDIIKIERSNSNVGINSGLIDTYRKGNHISQIDVLEADGKKYVYGLPVYNTVQEDVSFSISNGNALNTTSSYKPDVDDIPDSEDDPGNKHGREWLVQKEIMPAYAHSFLLTALISPNYVDLTGDGITEDDMGDAVKFNYSRFDQGFKWRTPTQKNIASYSEGLKTDPKDDKAHYVYGEREMWLLYSIESKNMIARFYVENDRRDARQVKGRHGEIDDNWGMQRLHKICLFSKADLLKSGSSAKPIKTVEFIHSYKLCKNINGTGSSAGQEGKLTLEGIKISYNGNGRSTKSQYLFFYPENNNPNYNYTYNDRWGNYKPLTDGSSNNIGGLTNSDFPYSVQDKTKADKYAAAWTLNKIVLPSGGTIQVDYEADEYAFVQDRRAANMFQISGFGETPTPTSNQRVNKSLYTNNGNTQYRYVYIKLSQPIANSSLDELRERYFADVNQLYMKLAVNMPAHPGIGGFEMISVYADIEEYGLVQSDVAWVKVKLLANGYTPMVQQSLQFIKQQLPGKAYPGYDVSDESNMEAVVKALVGMFQGIKSLAMGDNKSLMSRRIGEEVNVDKSFARLSNPILRKRGGGVRVKRVLISDNWNKMTGEYDATYGQEYKYDIKKTINGNEVEISSGVASWEPSIGNDENPHKELMRFKNRNPGGPYDFGGIELPLGEMLYPYPMVGYSRVEVVSIHRQSVKNIPVKKVTEFYTTKDFPFKSVATSLSDPDASSNYKPNPIMKLLKLDMKSHINLSQGFLIDMNDMNGKIKFQATYSGLNDIAPISYTKTYYNVIKNSDDTYKFNHFFKTVNGPDGVVHDNTVIGRSIEIMTDFREHKTETTTVNLSWNSDMFMIGPFPIGFLGLLRPLIKEGTRYRSAAIVKIINRYSMIDSVVTVTKGSMVKTENLVYDGETGNPILTKINNEHNKSVYNFSYPAHWAYSGMGPAYQNIDAVYHNLTFRNGFLEGNFDMSVFESGDEIYALSTSSTGPRPNYCDDITTTTSYFPPIVNNAPTQRNNENRIWAVNTEKVNSLTPSFIFIDKDGNPYNAKFVSIRIIRSGHRNMLNHVVGNIISHKNPVVNNQLVFNDNTNIIQASAATFKDHWRVDNDFYLFDSTTIENQYARIKAQSFIATKAVTTIATVNDGNFHTSSGSFFTVIQNQESLIGRMVSFKREYSWAYDSWINFNMRGALNTGLQNPTSKVIKSKLSLYSHIENNLEGNFTPNYHHGYENYGTNHTSQWSHLIRGGKKNNAVNILSMRAPWPTNSSQWQALFFDNNRNLHNWSSIGYIPTSGLTNGSSAYNYAVGDNRITIPNSAVEEMLGFARNYNSNVATGLRFMQSRVNPGDEKSMRKEDFSQCFFGVCSNVYQGNNFMAELCKSPKLSVLYYNCGDTSYDNHPYDEDPLWNTLIVCGQKSNHLSECRSKFTRKFINPYAQGIYGNWRPDLVYTYYGNRKEQNPNVDVDLRVAGFISDFERFWDFNTNPQSYYLVKNTNTLAWSWVSESTQFNRKGYETENKNPLGIYTSGLYGYNQQLPIATANNARVREILFEGFEDFSYSSDNDCIDCPSRRHFNFSENIVPDATEKHSGMYSLKVNAGQSISISAPVVSETKANELYGVRIKVDSTSYNVTTVNGNGTGLTGNYYNNANYSGIPYNTHNSNINFHWATGSPYPGMNPNSFSVIWKGKIQPRYSETYTFVKGSYDMQEVIINGSTVISSFSTTGNIYMQAGQGYDIEVRFRETGGIATAQLLWRSATQLEEIIPTSQLYPDGIIVNQNETVITTTYWCPKYASLNVEGNALNDTFAPIQNKKMLISAWVKENEDCKCSSYVNNKIVISYAGSSTTEMFMPSGNIIEGWQRYEGVFTIPEDATDINISMQNTSSNKPVYFDDLRIMPFNAQMQTMVYHESNLRLTAILDDNNHASFYEYDDDGTLTRVKKETVEGIKTIQETRSGLQTIINE